MPTRTNESTGCRPAARPPACLLKPCGRKPLIPLWRDDREPMLSAETDSQHAWRERAAVSKHVVDEITDKRQALS